MAPVFQAVYGFAVLVVVLWYTSMVWKVTDDYFRDEYKKHLKTSASEYSAKKKSQENIIPKEFKEDPPWMASRKSSGISTKDAGLTNRQVSEDAASPNMELSNGACYKHGYSDDKGTRDELAKCP
ncbi:Hypothetical protein NTJ_05357 [Nesidiocoris tenuis]|uniref:Uncharacterized protein n=1 Tax=Nesidiocoris tenuis TaxID=355587 RepID=A0ABN7AJW7_9HEMI|nr:Hypothetical protein NTJ_05357 [Nesidiocoris tenuis]